MKINVVLFMSLIFIGCKPKVLKTEQVNSISNPLNDTTLIISKKVESIPDKLDVTEKSQSSLVDATYFKFKNYKGYKLTDTITIDLNGNGILEKVYFDQTSCTKLIIDEPNTDQIYLGCKNEKYTGVLSSMDWVNLWYVVFDKETYEVIVEDGELLGSEKYELERPSIYIGKESAGGGIITYKNGELYWVHQSD